jgi:transposase
MTQASLEKRIAALDARLADVLRQNAELRRENAALKRKVAQLEERLAQNSQNSSKPPSSDPPWLPRSPKKPKGVRKPGGQQGHEGHERVLVPPDQVDERLDFWPERCEGCSADLAQGPRLEAGEPIRYQLVELPQVKPHVTEWCAHTQCCPDCEWATTAQLPEEALRSGFGPRVQALVSVCTGTYRLSKRATQALLSDLFGITMSLGAVSACERRTSEALEGPFDEALRYARCQSVGYADETGWRQGQQRAWVWVLVTRWVTVFLIRARRGADAAKELLGRFSGVLVSDRWCAYSDWPIHMRQLCWAHLLRYFIAFSERRNEARRIGLKLVELTGQMFKWWHKVRDGTMAPSTFRTHMRPVQTEVERLLDQGTRCGHAKVEGTCRAILDLAPALWTFVRVEGVEPTNNAAERALRPSVIMRKTSFGTYSVEGSRFVERMLTVTATLRQQHRNVLNYVTEACERFARGENHPSLLSPLHMMERKAA